MGPASNWWQFVRVGRGRARRTTLAWMLLGGIAWADAPQAFPGSVFPDSVVQPELHRFPPVASRPIDELPIDTPECRHLPLAPADGSTPIEDRAARIAARAAWGLLPTTDPATPAPQAAPRAPAAPLAALPVHASSTVRGPRGMTRPTEDAAAPVPPLEPAVAERARTLVQDGIGLAERGALYSARARFIMALRLTTQALDAQTQTQQFSRALDNGLRALQEAADFQPQGSRLEAQLDLQQVVRTHRTVILKRTDLSSWTATAALQSYHAYAEQQLGRAGGHDMVAADALFGLARLQPFLTAGNANQESSAGPTAMSLYQSALIIQPAHCLAANELAAMFGRYGQWHDAREVLRHAVQVRPDSPVLWENLAHVHDRLGEQELAARARHEWQVAADASRQSAAANSGPAVQWVDAATFAATSRADVEQEMPSRESPYRRR